MWLNSGGKVLSGDAESRSGFAEAGRGGEIMSYQACIFDLDGTLCDSVESIAFCANRALRDLNLKEPSVEQYKILVGDGVDELIRRLLRNAGDEKAVHFEELKSLYMEYFKEGCMYRVKPYPGIVGMLKELKKEGAKLCVLSNKPHRNTVDVIEQVFGTEMFDLVQGQSVPLPESQVPAGALFLAENLKIAPENCLYVGDTGTDEDGEGSRNVYDRRTLGLSSRGGASRERSGRRDIQSGGASGYLQRIVRNKKRECGKL